MLRRIRRNWGKQRMGRTVDFAELREGRREGRCERGRVAYTQDILEVGSETQATAEGRGGCSRWEGNTRCSSR